MLKNEDLESFVELVNHAKLSREVDSPRKPDIVLMGTKQSDRLLHRNELRQLKSSLTIASVAGDVHKCVLGIMRTITENLTNPNICYLPLSASKEWKEAIRWAITNPAANHFASLPFEGNGRQFAVGSACRALRDKGYEIEIGALGPGIASVTRAQIGKRVDKLISQMGGKHALGLLCHYISQHGKIRGGVWLLGNVHTRVHRKLNPEIPIGWLLGIALRHIHCPPQVDDPAQAWGAAVDCATELAATTDCQSYNPYDGVSLDVRDFLSVFEESLAWRELFMLPQVPTLVLPIVREAFNQINWPKNTSILARNVDGMLGELCRLLKHVNEHQWLEISQSQARKNFPLLWKYARGKRGYVNANFLDPFDTNSRNSDEFVFFESVNDSAVVLPSPLNASNGLTAIFTRIWRKAGQTTGANIVGNVVEKAIAVACRAHRTQVCEHVRYDAGGQEFEVDVAVREGQELVLFESKAKSLTRKSRTGDIVAFIDDYTKSFLALLTQLVRHDQHIKCGLTPLTRDEEDAAALRVRKVAVSPLSYGPVADNVLLNSVTIAISRARLDSVDGNPDYKKVFDAFNKKVELILEDVLKIAPNRDGEMEMYRYLMDVCWFDLGQLLYALHRGRSVVRGVSALRHLTFSTRDYWTEAALADRQDLTSTNWHPLEEE